MQPKKCRIVILKKLVSLQRMSKIDSHPEIINLVVPKRLPNLARATLRPGSQGDSPGLKMSMLLMPARVCLLFVSLCVRCHSQNSRGTFRHHSLAPAGSERLGVISLKPGQLDFQRREFAWIITAHAGEH